MAASNTTALPPLQQSLGQGSDHGSLDALASVATATGDPNRIAKLLKEANEQWIQRAESRLVVRYFEALSSQSASQSKRQQLLMMPNLGTRRALAPVVPPQPTCEQFISTSALDNKIRDLASMNHMESQRLGPLVTVVALAVEDHVRALLEQLFEITKQRKEADKELFPRRLMSAPTRVIELRREREVAEVRRRAQAEQEKELNEAKQQSRSKSKAGTGEHRRYTEMLQEHEAKSAKEIKNKQAVREACRVPNHLGMQQTHGAVAGGAPGRRQYWQLGLEHVVPRGQVAPGVEGASADNPTNAAKDEVTLQDMLSLLERLAPRRKSAAIYKAYLNLDSPGQERHRKLRAPPVTMHYAPNPYPQAHPPPMRYPEHFSR